MNKKLIVCALFGLSGSGLWAMEAEDSYKPTKQERIEAMRSFLEDHKEIIDPSVTLPELSASQFQQLTPREQAFIGERGEALSILNRINSGHEVSDTGIDLLHQYIAWAVGRANLGWNHSRIELGGDDVLTAAVLREKMEGLLVQKPQRGHRRAASTAEPLTTMDLIREKAIQAEGKKSTSPKMVPFDLRRGLSEKESQEAVERFRKLHSNLITAAASAYKGKEAIPEESSGESSEE